MKVFDKNNLVGKYAITICRQELILPYKSIYRDLKAYKVNNIEKEHFLSYKLLLEFEDFKMKKHYKKENISTNNNCIKIEIYTLPD